MAILSRIGIISRINIYIFANILNTFCGGSTDCCKCSAKTNDEYPADNITINRNQKKQIPTDIKKLLGNKLSNFKMSQSTMKKHVQFNITKFNEINNIKSNLSNKLSSTINSSDVVNTELSSFNNESFTDDPDKESLENKKIKIDINNDTISIESHKYTKINIDNKKSQEIIRTFFTRITNLYYISNDIYDLIKENLHNISVIFKSGQESLPYILAIAKNGDNNYLIFCKDANTIRCEALFYGTRNSEIVIIQNGALSDISYMFSNCSVKYIDLSNFNTSSVKNFGWAFGRCNNLLKIDLTNIDTKNATNMRSMFYNNKNLLEIKLGDRFDTSKVTDLSYMFDNCNNLKTLNLSKFSTTNVKKANYMFYECNNLSELVIGDNFNITNVSQKGILTYCDKLEKIYINASKNNSFDSVLKDKYSYDNITMLFTKKD